MPAVYLHRFTVKPALTTNSSSFFSLNPSPYKSSSKPPFFHNLSIPLCTLNFDLIRHYKNRGRMSHTAVICVFTALLALQLHMALAEDPYLFFTWNVSYGTISPLGVPQQVIMINGEFPGPKINCSSNNNIVVNVFNHLDEPFLLSWYLSFFLLTQF